MKFLLSLSVAFFVTLSSGVAQTTFLNNGKAITTELTADSLKSENDLKVKVTIPAEALKYDMVSFEVHYFFIGLLSGREVPMVFQFQLTKSQMEVLFANKKDTTLSVMTDASPFDKVMSNTGGSTINVGLKSSELFPKLKEDVTHPLTFKLIGHIAVSQTTEWNSSSSSYYTRNNYDQGNLISSTSINVKPRKKS